MQETEAYTTIKDHKEDFPNKISCCLIIAFHNQIQEKSAKLLMTRSTKKYN